MVFSSTFIKYKLYENSISRADIVGEYEITPSALDGWIKNHPAKNYNHLYSYLFDDSEVIFSFPGQIILQIANTPCKSKTIPHVAVTPFNG